MDNQHQYVIHVDINILCCGKVISYMILSTLFINEKANHYIVKYAQGTCLNAKV